MKTKSTEEFNMFLKIKDLLAANHKVWGNIKEIEKAVKKFNRNIDDMKELTAGINMNLKGIEEKKDKGKNALVNEAFPVINIIRAYAIEHKNKSLLKKCGAGRQKLEKMKSDKLSDYCKTMIKEARKLYNKSILLTDKENLKQLEKSNILNYGLSVPMIENLKELNLNFMDARAIYAEAKAEKEKFIYKYRSLAKNNKKILSDKLDLLLSIFEASNNNFYKNYRELRKGEKAKKEKSIKIKGPETKVEVSVPQKTVVAKEKTVQKKTVARPQVKKTVVKTPAIPGAKKVSPPKPKPKVVKNPDEEAKV
jgi:hypothetical protein